ncbi:glycoside hydrolase family 97 protein [Sphingopyxis sp. RIFCSPHIGHO2_12_FULL_65_19]|uniref:glycoside hydrolase family 97 protein n=1 Tax=Sphingopyxis sp. RIFCSPHIGHO2_12_FULL_65_19 TaxID=1802172 RepID=UPI0008C14026|nr:glycoside hydrolase family 97 protein [Sphingopyxis sp. RIFCSPHIGHO2_12_FULL_65_19]OHD09937.1 MAG: alpha-glucosidase [Sphingopyxis sp. RIFCSPHIGHO2_12_FULL_65_19]
MRNLLLLAAAVAAPAAAQEAPITAASPDGSIILTVATDNDQRPTWSLSRKGKLLIAPSKLGFILADRIGLQRGFAVESAERAKSDTRWELPWGERRFVRDQHNELLVRFRQNDSWGGHRMNVRFRLFDDGFGFRYELPEQDGLKTAKIADEITEFDIAAKGTAWWIPGGEWNRYEQVYQETAIDAIATAHTPITMRLDDGTHLSLHEAALVDYSGMWLKRAEGQKFRATLAPSSRGPRVVRDLPFATPWRTIRIADDAAGLVESDLELNLNEPNKLGDVSWFKPMKYVGIWWGMIRGDWSWAEGAKHGATTERTKATIDFAAKHGFGGVLVEGWNKGWNGNWFGHGDAYSFTEATPDFDLKAVTDYARAKRVQLVGHHETGGNIAVYEAQLDDAMKLYGGLGVGTVKTGYVADAGGIIAPGDAPGETRMEWHDGQRQVQHHQKVVETAAKYHVAVNPHEPVKDTGLRRTWPNWVAREGARGMEYNAWGAFANGPEHEPTLVYTRMLSGPMDFTPGVLSLEGANKAPLASTLAKQLGLYLAIYSPIQMAADFPETLEKFPRELAFIKQVPADWADSKLIAGAVGDYAIFARKDRASADWYVGGVNDATPRTLTLRFDFLDAGKTYTATVYKDGEGATYLTEARHRIAYETIKVKKGDSYTLWLAPGGGAAIRLAAPR